MLVSLISKCSRVARRRAVRNIEILVAVAISMACSGIALAIEAPEVDPQKIEFFEKEVRPILVSNCYNCHSADNKAAGGLRVDDHLGLLAGGSSGPAIVPGKPDESILIQAIRYEGFEMPPKKRLADDEVATLVKWVADGAVWPVEQIATSIGKPNEQYDKLKTEHWAWQPLAQANVPSVQNTAWPRTEIDHFILAKLEAANLSPVEDADKLSLLRRVTFDLTGLPPTPEEIDAYVADESANAFEKVVDRLLSSPAYGERWGRHWLDIARYGESTGSARNVPYPHAWRYRDYVIKSIGEDKPYDQFLKEQIAGDLLPAISPTQKAEQLTATGFLALGVKDVNQRFKVRFIMDNVDEQIDTVTRSVLGLTVSCARCHDHKFDPIPTADYYALAGIFTSTDLCAGVRNKMGGGGLDYYDSAMLIQVGVATGEKAHVTAQVEELQAKVEAAKSEFERLRDSAEGEEKAPNGRPKRQVARQKLNRLQQELLALTDPATQVDVAHGVRDAKQIADTQVRIRGEAERIGPVVPRGFLSLVNVPDARPMNTSQSGRLELAEWLTSSQNPLTSRVIANRVWHYLLGKGLVQSVDNFGVTGDTPSHPELLDHLAAKFVADGWSLKKAIRSVVLSRAYQLSAAAGDSQMSVDPANRLVWRHSPRRLEAEELRDAMLAVASSLDVKNPGASPAAELKMMEIRNNGPEAAKLSDLALASKHRSIYLPLVRGIVPTSLGVFDFAEQGMVTGSRDVTTVSTQALYLLNDPLVRRQSLVLADQLLADSTLSDEARLSVVYRRTLGRTPSSEELLRATEFLDSYEQVWLAAKSQASADAPEVAVDQPAETTADAATANTNAAANATANAIVDPDNVDQTDLTVRNDSVEAATSKSAALAAFVQAIFGSAEFRYVK
ncbi:protein of unknown function DUF1549 [Pirellula staleyi DSM 6068]|uniref:Cytochrome c domain-containing protein n=1 Tax=Pirellula staleyi (strain ATCC 27377 / DSM 6068 / ICPB 4128) TaxID=530564 RepID=D2R299_PIRSD|nr:protein of unknown function DUF1549 [Pirellula staleyi DSM 6068]